MVFLDKGSGGISQQGSDSWKKIKQEVTILKHKHYGAKWKKQRAHSPP